MSETLMTSIVTVALAIVGVAIIAVLVSRNANTANVISAGSQGLSSGLLSALSPVTGVGTGSFSVGFTGGAL
jgi:PRD1 phage membrane DNA delivery